MTDPGTGVDVMVGVSIANFVEGGVAVTVRVEEGVGARPPASVGVDCDWPDGWKMTFWGGWKK